MLNNLWNRLNSQFPKRSPLKKDDLTFEREIRDRSLLTSLEQLLGSDTVQFHELTEKGCAPLMVITTDKHPTARIVTHLHGDEPQPGEPLLLILSKLLRKKDPRLQHISYIPRANAEAFGQGLRGIRADLHLLETLANAGVISPEVIHADMETEEIVQILQDKQIVVSFDSNLGLHFIDLNRQFKSPGKDNLGQLSPTLEQLAFPKARLLRREAEEISPETEYVFSFHADNRETTMANDEHHRIYEVNNGCYVYDCPYFDDDDQRRDKNEDKVVMLLMSNLRQKLMGISPNVSLLTGYDDISDKTRGYYFEDGYASTPVVWGVRGDYEPDETLRGLRGKNKVKRTFCFETPTWLLPDENYKVVEAYLFEFVLPFLDYANKKNLN